MNLDLQTTHVYHEIHEQPEVLAHAWCPERRSARPSRPWRRKFAARTWITSSSRHAGTSDNAARYAQYLLGAANRLQVGLAAPSLYTIYEAPPRFGNALVLGISQSGKSPDIVAVLAEARRQGALTAALTNFPASDLGQAAEFVIGLQAGEEKAVAATKTYTAELAAIALLSVALNGGERREALHRVPEQVAEVLTLHEDIALVAERYRYMTTCVTIGRGYNYATAFEMALKLKEMTYTVVEPYSSADFLHGPLALVALGFPVIVVAPSGRMLPELKAFMTTVEARQGELAVISDDASALGMARIPLALPAGVPEWLSPIVSIVPGQLLAMNLAHTVRPGP